MVQIIFMARLPQSNPSSYPTERMKPLDDSDNPLAVEIRHEAATSYFTACQQMSDAIEALKAFDRTAGSSPCATGPTQRRTNLLEEAAERVFFVLIQREAMKFSHSDKFFKDYGIPAEVRACLGPKRR